MLVCLCKGVSDKHVRGAIARGATTIAEVGDECGAGTGCGACHEMIGVMLADGGASTPLELARAAGGGGCPGAMHCARAGKDAA